MKKGTTEAKISFSRRAKIKFVSEYFYKEEADGNEIWGLLWGPA